MNLHHPTARRLPPVSGGRLSAIALLPALVLACATLPAHAVSYQVSIDTRPIAGRTGSVDLQWNVAATGAGLAASVADFAGPTLSGAAVPLAPGDVGGSFAAGSLLDFGGRQSFSYIYQPVSFGSSVAFRLTLPDQGPELPGVSGGSVFAVSLLDVDALPLLPAEADSGASLRFDLAAGAAPVVTAFSSATVTVVTAAVPEASTWALLLAGLAACGLRTRDQNRRAAFAGKH